MKTKFGVSFGMHPERIYSPEETYAFAEAAETLGYDSLWIGDHVSFYGHYTESLTTLAAFAARTSRITLGTGVYLLPLRTSRHRRQDRRHGRLPDGRGALHLRRRRRGRGKDRVRAMRRARQRARREDG